MRYGRAVVGGSLLAGCAARSGSEATPTGTDGSDGTPPTATETETEDSGHSVTTEPMGTVEFESAPETWMGDYGFAAAIGVALGQFDGLVAAASPSWYTGF
jgi:iron complex transport system substrate-binding protein